ncbi:5-guanidino-2-oxopentanoate decarboxylase [Streptomyces sp. NPDC007346]|uniref:5-guanidino-2-oxopentanoate decarboxylase n=1 Tax=Streptomyces sp. NPDC007346 TaxID=3154682 RepID=UPI0034513F8A
MPSVGELLVSALREHAVEVVFGIPGTHNLGIYAHLDGYGLRHITPRHEQGAGYAADGYARVSGRPGVVITTSGPGLLNAAAAVGQAYSDSVPLLLISPGMPLAHHPGAGLLHETRDQSAALAAVCAASHRVTDPAALPALVAEIFASFATGRPRPVHLEIPYDLIDRVVDAPPAAPLRTGARPPDAEAADRAAAFLAAAERPVIVAGGGARGAGAEVRALAELLGAPVVTTANGKGVLAESHRLALGATLHVPAVQELLAACDAVLAVGTELSETDTWNGPLRLGGALVRVDTDPGQLHRNSPAAHPLAGDSAETLSALLVRLRPTDGPPVPRGGAETPQGRPARSAAAFRDARAGVRAYGRRWHGIVGALREALPEDAVLTNDSAMACYFGAIAGFPVERPGRFLYPTGFGTLGYALPAAIGAALARPGRPVAALSGDGGFQFSVNELATAVELGVPLPVVVVSNGGYGMIRREMTDRGQKPLGVDLTPPDFVALSRAYGGHGVHVGSPAELRDAVRHALSVPGPTLVVVPEPPMPDGAPDAAEE